MAAAAEGQPALSAARHRATRAAAAHDDDAHAHRRPSRDTLRPRPAPPRLDRQPAPRRPRAPHAAT
eukprot:2900619-Prymnesium_polylepis.1